MTPSRPYLFRAINEWLLDNDMTPYMLVNAMDESTSVPQQYVQDGEIVLNISPGSVENLMIDNTAVSFSARFRGQPFAVYVPMRAIQSIYAKENGQGTVFADEDGFPVPDDDPEPPKPPKQKPQLRVVK